MFVVFVYVCAILKCFTVNIFHGGPWRFHHWYASHCASSTGEMNDIKLILKLTMAHARMTRRDVSLTHLFSLDKANKHTHTHTSNLDAISKPNDQDEDDAGWRLYRIYSGIWQLIRIFESVTHIHTHMNEWNDGHKLEKQVLFVGAASRFTSQFYRNLRKVIYLRETEIVMPQIKQKASRDFRLQNAFVRLNWSVDLFIILP